jgi:prephenate dehydratase
LNHTSHVNSVPRYGYLGPEGTFTEIALRTLPVQPGARLVPTPSAAAAVAAVKNRDLTGAMLPLQNTEAGIVPATIQALTQESELVISHEIRLPIRFALLVRDGTTSRDIRTVAGHLHALPQAQRWLAAHVPDAAWVPVSSNAVGALQVRQGYWDAALAPESAASVYGLVAAATGIQDRPGATTRFVMLMVRDRAAAPTGADRTSLLGRPDGDELCVLDTIKHIIHGCRDLPVHYRAHFVPGPRRSNHLIVDCSGHVDDPSVRMAVDRLQLRIPTLRSFGSYPIVTPRMENAHDVQRYGSCGTGDGGDPLPDRRVGRADRQLANPTARSLG